MNLSDYSASQLMSTGVITISASSSIRTAIKTMRSERVQALVVQPPSPGDSHGIITVKDIVGAIETAGGASEEVYGMMVAELMTRPVICAQETMHAADCVTMMRMTGVRRLIIQRGDQVVGVLSYTDVFNEVARHTAQTTAATDPMHRD